MNTEPSIILPFVKDQISYLYAQSKLANISQLGATLLIFIGFNYYGEAGYMLWFCAVQLMSTVARYMLNDLFQKATVEQYSHFANAYVAIVILLGINWSILNIVYYDIDNTELTIFVTLISLGLITASIGTLASWLPAYFSFGIPLYLSLIITFVLNQNYFMVLALIPFGLFMRVVAISNNTQFKQSRILIHDNVGLIEQMYKEIDQTKVAKEKLEVYKTELETIIQDRTRELSEANNDLKNQISRRTEIEKDLERLAYYDVLTGLANRSLLIDRLGQAIKIARRQKQLFAVLFIDLDRFKSINDSLGHDLGDRLLKEVAGRLRELLRQSDTIARNGGDEFVVLLENLNDVREVFIVAEKIISTMTKIFSIESHEIHIGASIGISVYPLDGEDALEMLKMADTAMYCAKEQGTNQFEFYSSHMSTQIQDRLDTENALRSALKNNELFLVFQPQVDAFSLKTVGFESLLRWKNAEHGMVSPAKFIPVMEEMGLIYDVGEWIIAEVIAFIKQNKNHGCKVSINLSSLQCARKQVSDAIVKMVEKSEIDPSLIEFEITESILINDFNKTENFLQSIHDMGCTIALDDFGTGYTSFGYLARLPIDIIKIDRSLITDIHKNKNLEDITRAIVTMSQSLNIENIFEGVETEKEIEVIQRIGGRVIQGYYFSKPLEEEQIEYWFEKAQSNGRQNKPQTGDR